MTGKQKNTVAVFTTIFFCASQVVGRIISRIGYKTIMVDDTLILVIVCFCYGFAHHIFPRAVAFLLYQLPAQRSDIAQLARRDSRKPEIDVCRYPGSLWRNSVYHQPDRKTFRDRRVGSGTGTQRTAEPASQSGRNCGSLHNCHRLLRLSTTINPICQFKRNQPWLN